MGINPRHKTSERTRGRFTYKHKCLNDFVKRTSECMHERKAYIHTIWMFEHLCKKGRSVGKSELLP